MTRTFIQTLEFVKNWGNLGFTDDNLRRLEWEILQNPKRGDIIPGTGRLRKMRFAREDAGKSGGVRICYVDFEEKRTVYLITVYSKNRKDNLSPSECQQIRKLIVFLEKLL